ncbi:Thioesterase/thiol ester dehydrase-isomerase [Poronia punctata]|nr:Thioesterase/thiol ester dehydrase-isomerase [Poronia punctata]
MPLPSVEAVRKGHGRLTFQEAMRLIALPDKVADDGKVIRRYMSRRKVWITGDDLKPLAYEMGARNFKSGTSAYGGHVYGQAALAASRAFRASQTADGNNSLEDKKLGIHTIHGYFSEAGREDRPFIYEVITLASNALFPNLLVTVRQPTSPSTGPELDYYPLSDADMPLGPVCFSALVSFRPASITQLDVQEPPPQRRFAEILASRKPREWDPAPITDIEGILSMIPGARKAVGLFAGLEMRKVDMRGWNEGKPIHERREIILYRLLAPLAEEAGGGSVGEDGPDGPDAHIAAHAYGADRNGLLMIGNHAGFGRELARAASLSYSFVVHVDAADAVMRHEGEGNEYDQWWIQETSFPRLQAGRGIVHCKIWSPSGVHVATEYQDGIIRRTPRPGDKGQYGRGKPAVML